MSENKVMEQDSPLSNTKAKSNRRSRLKNDHEGYNYDQSNAYE